MAEGGEVTMREMTTGDIDGVLEIERVSFAAPWTRGMFEETLSSPVGMSLVAEQEGRIVGYLVFYFAATEMHVMNIAVKQNRRGLGLASWMMSRVMDLARRNSIETCFLEVRESNVPPGPLREARLQAGRQAQGVLPGDRRGRHRHGTRAERRHVTGNRGRTVSAPPPRTI